MKTIKTGLIVSALIVPGAILSSGTAYAEDFPRTAAAAQLSMTRGFNQSALPLLHRTAAVDPAKASTFLLEKLCPAPCSNASANSPGTAMRVANDHWSLDIAADGSAALFRDADVEARAHCALARRAVDRRSRGSCVSTSLQRAVTCDCHSDPWGGPPEDL